MEKLEKKSIEIQNYMHHSVTHDFDRVSDYNENDSTPLQGEMNSQKMLIVQKMPLNMMQLTY